MTAIVPWYHLLLQSHIMKQMVQDNGHTTLIASATTISHYETNGPGWRPYYPDIICYNNITLWNKRSRMTAILPWYHLLQQYHTMKETVQDDGHTTLISSATTISHYETNGPGWRPYYPDSICYNNLALWHKRSRMTAILPWWHLLQQSRTMTQTVQDDGHTTLISCATTISHYETNGPGWRPYCPDVICYNNLTLLNQWSRMTAILPWYHLLRQYHTMKQTVQNDGHTALMSSATTISHYDTNGPGWRPYYPDIICYNNITLWNKRSRMTAILPWCHLLQQSHTMIQTVQDDGHTTLILSATTISHYETNGPGWRPYYTDIICYNNITLWNKRSRMTAILPWCHLLQQSHTMIQTVQDDGHTTLILSATTISHYETNGPGWRPYYTDIICYNNLTLWYNGPGWRPYYPDIIGYYNLTLWNKRSRVTAILPWY